MSQTTRRSFLKLTTAATSLTAVELSRAAPVSDEVAVILDHDSPISTSEPVQWAVEQLRGAFTAKGIRLSDASRRLCILVSPNSGALAKNFGSLPNISQAETTALIPGTYKGAPAILVTGMDARGLAYGITEL
ncbi:MAG TPA: twin-arginine translocation signal domain-containing protein, partial [Edaphobacter sp.]|nr:twin-arginine translocation signal domain-containing protein [Edaphobacter sp.]